MQDAAIGRTGRQIRKWGVDGAGQAFPLQCRGCFFKLPHTAGVQYITIKTDFGLNTVVDNAPQILAQTIEGNVDKASGCYVAEGTRHCCSWRKGGDGSMYVSVSVRTCKDYAALWK
jgi:hypothetical protein